MPGLQEKAAPSEVAGLISMENAIDFLAQAKKLQNSSFLLHEAAKRLGRFFRQMPLGVASQLEPKFSLKILSMHAITHFGHPCRKRRRATPMEMIRKNDDILKLTTACLENNLSAEVFNELSSKQQLDFRHQDGVFVQNVLTLLAMESSFLAPGGQTLSSLQERFMSCNSKSFCGKMKSVFQSKEELFKQMSKLSQLLAYHNMLTDSVWAISSDDYY